MKWKTNDGYEFDTELKDGEVKSFFGGGRVRERKEGWKNPRDSSRRADTKDENGIRRDDGKDQSVSKSESEGTAAGKDET